LADAVTSPDYAVLALEVAAVSAVLFLGGLLFGLAVVGVAPRILHRLVRKNVVYPLFGFHYGVFRAIARLSNSPVYNLLFGDSALIIPYLRYVGYRLNTVVQTGSNFGLAQKHDNPFLCDIGSGTMVSDGLAMLNAPMSASSFVLREVRIGAKNYLGNNVNFPAGAMVGDNCLLGTKVLVPVDGPMRENAGLLGSPAFEIPRVVERDRRLQVTDEVERRRLVAEKTKYNLATLAGYLGCIWVLFAANLFLLTVAILQFPTYGAGALVVYAWAALALDIGFFVSLEHASLHFGRLKPQIVSMYDRGFWFHERHWKFCGNPLLMLFKGTPMKNVITRLVGVRIGRKVFDDGGLFFDKTLLEIGDNATLNESCLLKGHSLEEGVFKADAVRIGAGCSIGPAALVHYGVTMGDGVVLDADSFLMKGESPEAGTRWRGNPAREVASGRWTVAPVEVALPAARADATGDSIPAPAAALAALGS
jgi:non-ribosomal peptide synthetase-like protein